MQPSNLISYSCSVLKHRRTASSLNIANYASRRTALFIATCSSCDVMPYTVRTAWRTCKYLTGLCFVMFVTDLFPSQNSRYLLGYFSLNT